MMQAYYRNTTPPNCHPPQPHLTSPQAEQATDIPTHMAAEDRGFRCECMSACMCELNHLAAFESWRRHNPAAYSGTNSTRRSARSRPKYYFLLYVRNTTDCVLILLYMCPDLLIDVSSYYYVCVLVLLSVSSYYYVCVLILVYMCPHATVYVSS